MSQIIDSLNAFLAQPWRGIHLDQDEQLVLDFGQLTLVNPDEPAPIIASLVGPPLPDPRSRVGSWQLALNTSLWRYLDHSGISLMTSTILQAAPHQSLARLGQLALPLDWSNIQELAIDMPGQLKLCFADETRLVTDISPTNPSSWILTSPLAVITPSQRQLVYREHARATSSEQLSGPITTAHVVMTEQEACRITKLSSHSQAATPH